jgi:hypothetical protein
MVREIDVDRNGEIDFDGEHKKKKKIVHWCCCKRVHCGHVSASSVSIHARGFEECFSNI